jgi:Leucine-rich repeat (LRR) protein
MSKRDKSPRRSPRLWEKLIDWTPYQRQWAVFLNGLKGKLFIHMPQQLIALKEMTTLQMDNNNLRILDPVLGQLTQLQSLELWNNPILSLPPTISKLQSLFSLVLGGLPMKSLPDEVFDMPSLSNLRINHCPFSEISPKIGQLTKLTTLRLLGTKISKLPDELFSLPSLQMLDLRENKKLTSISPKIGQLTSLEFLAIRKVPLLTWLPWELFMCSNLNHIVATGNPQLRTDPADGGLGYNPGNDNQTFSRNSWNNSDTCAWGLGPLTKEWGRLFKRRKWKREILLYFYNALECDVPILEAIWITSK